MAGCPLTIVVHEFVGIIVAQGVSGWSGDLHLTWLSHCLLLSAHRDNNGCHGECHDVHGNESPVHRHTCMTGHIILNDGIGGHGHNHAWPLAMTPPRITGVSLSMVGVVL